MTDSDRPDPHDVDPTVAAALRRAERQAGRLPADDTLDAARAARDRHARARRRRVRAVTLGAAAAVLVVVVGAALALNQNPTETHVAGPAPQTVTTHQDSTVPSTNGGADGWPIPAQQAADACPDSPAPTPHQVPGASGPLVDIDPVEAIVCVYAVDGQREGSVLADPVNLGRISAGLASLEPVPVDQACTDEMGPIVALILTDAERTEVVWLQFYGCGAAFSGDQVRTGAKALSWLVP